MKMRWVVVLGLVSLAAVCQHVPPREQRFVFDEQSLRQRAYHEVEGRAIWVTRWDYKTPKDVVRIIDNAARTHFNIVLFQVRGNATAFYHSSIEPWAWELTSSGPLTTGYYPGFDPLALAIERARKRKIELHVWMNAFPAWRSQTYPPARAKQLWTTHPEWFMVDRKGRKMIPRDRDVDPRLGTFYSFVNPALPAVQDYTVAVYREMAERYDVDGIHFDYIRYPHEIGDYSYDEVSLQRFRQETGKTPDAAPEAWVRWRGEQVSRVVRRVHDECKKIAPHLMVSASVGRDPYRARDKLMQRSFDWMTARKIDAVFPMIYTRENAEITQSVTTYVTRGSGRLVFAGLMVPKEPRPLLQQIAFARMANAHGVSLFSYGALFPDHKPNALARALAQGPFRKRAVVPLPSRGRPDDPTRPLPEPVH